MMRNRTGLFLVALVLAGMAIAIIPTRSFAAGLEADMVVYNGKILTVDSPNPESYSTVQAVAIHHGEFVAVGSND